MTEKQKRFIAEYMIDLNATRAAIRAGYSPKTANEQGARLLANVSIQTELQKAMAARSKRTGISQDRVVQELARIAFVNPKDVIDTKTGEVVENASPDDLACIQSVKVKTMDGDKGFSEEREIKLNDKLRALEMLGKHLGMWNDKVNLDVDAELSIKIDYGDGDEGGEA